MYGLKPKPSIFFVCVCVLYTGIINYKFIKCFLILVLYLVVFSINLKFWGHPFCFLADILAIENFDQQFAYTYPVIAFLIYLL